jgi:hypothetical protein
MFAWKKHNLAFKIYVLAQAEYESSLRNHTPRFKVHRQGQVVEGV